MVVDADGILKKIHEACRQARQDTLNSGRSVIEVHDGWLVETFPDGSRRQIEKLPESNHVPKGTILKVKKLGLD